MTSRVKWQDTFLILLFTYLIIDICTNWSAYEACHYPIQAFLLLTYSLITVYELAQIIKAYFHSSNLTQLILSYFINIIMTLGFLYATIQGIIWQELNQKKSPNCVPSDRLPFLTWFWIIMLIIVDIASIIVGIFRIIRWWRIRSYRRRIQTLVDEIMMLHGQQAQRLEDFLNMMPSLNDLEATMNDQLGLSKEDLNRISKKIYTKGYRMFLSLSQQQLCPICFEDYKVGEEVSVLPVCSHMFHSRCIEKWLGQNPLCPMCRNNIRNDLLAPLLDHRPNLEETEPLGREI